MYLAGVRSSRRFPLAVGSALLVASGCAASGCLVYTDELLVEAEGGQGGVAGASAGGMGGMGGGAAHLLISEIVVTPTRAEMVEIWNPGQAAVDLDSVWLADFAEYHTVAQGTPSAGETDFAVSFPPGMSLGAGERLVVAVAPAADFEMEFGQPADLDLAAMSGTKSAMSGLANTAEMIVLFQWDGVSAIVTDLDYVLWGTTAEAADKSGVAGYVPDTPPASQSVAAVPGPSQGLHRCAVDEGAERESGGNGSLGHDETSEDLAATFAVGAATPKASPPAGVCP
jgi:hypothetical protein